MSIPFNFARLPKMRQVLLSTIFIVVLLACGGSVGTAPAGMEQARVIRVVDGDTIEVRLAGREQRVRYILIDTPEVSGRGEPLGREATAANAALVMGQTVWLERDVSDTDRFGRLLRYVYVGDTMVNEALLEQGLARVATFPPDVKYVDRFLAVQREARVNQVGLWADVDLDCSDFASQAEAQAFFEAVSGDPHHLDGDGNGIVCERLP